FDLQCAWTSKEYRCGMGIDALDRRAVVTCGIGKEGEHRFLGLSVAHMLAWLPSGRMIEETVMTQLPHVLKRIRLNLARSKEFPSGSDEHGYEFVAPLDADGHIDVELWRKYREHCGV